MLVLSRKCGEKVVLPELGVVLSVVEVRGGHVRLGVTAPDGVPVHREEVWERLRALTAPAPAPAVTPDG
jgi:carbon storage regulator